MLPSEVNLWVQYESEPSVENRNALATYYFPLATSLAGQRGLKRPARADDYSSVASECLMRLVEEFDRSMGLEFWAFARPRLQWALVDFDRKADSSRRKLPPPKTLQYDEELAHESNVPEPCAELMQAEELDRQRSIVDAAVASSPIRQEILLLLRDGKQPQEIADTLGLTRQRVYCELDNIRKTAKKLNGDRDNH